ncbi:DNA polymerase III subunit gamma/tau [Oscillibacter valericigenes]|uniref:DNA polymerase III subunit gamma/tau n=1 Tax=Oscillibacter valericigenes TaxID=351091 RepID=UPI001F3F1A05|nr:DNA polymerase III subunit gamma/tau [Oscillibacter valericigenes]MCF2664871.1 DNA polymerase III subunit gamma/tau [Oscillibacter valericigenes]
MYQALYRKWRPKVFSDVIGQSHITETLQKQVAEGRTSHAYLFTGTRGTGKTTCAKILAKAVNCEHPVNGDPCCQCPSCVGIESGSFLDVLELDAASNNGVDQVRALRDEAIYSPANVKKRVYIVDEVHMLSTPAFNALLKILEEPPEHLMFILATTELHKVPATILSRCQRYSFKRITPTDIAQRLTYVAGQEHIDLTPDGAEILARLADGALRDGLSLLDQCAAAGGKVDSGAVLDVLGLAGNLQTAQLLECILRRDAKAALLLLNQLYAGGKDVGAVLGELSTLVRDLLLRRTAPEGGAALLSGGYDSATLDRLSKDVPGSRFLHLASTLQKATADLYYSSNRRTDAELCILRLCDESLSGDLTALEARIQRLEDALARGQVIRSAVEQSVAAAKPARETAPAKQEDMPPWEEPAAKQPPAEKKAPPAEEERPPLPEEPPMPQEPGERVFDVPEPMRETARPAAAAAAASAVGGNWWRALAEACKGRLSPMYRVFLDMCTGVLEGDQLTVYAPDDITLNRLDNDRVKGVLSEEAGNAAGTAVRLLLRVGEPPKASPQENLKNLLKFGSQFDNIEIK